MPSFTGAQSPFGSAVDLSEMGTIADGRILGNNSGGASVPLELTAAQVRTLLALVIGTNVQAYDADLTTYAGITPSANVQSVLGAANYAAIKSLLGIVIAQSYTQTYSTADRTHANPTGVTLTDSTGVTPNTTIENVPAATGDAGGASFVSDPSAVATVSSVNTSLTAIENSLSDLADQHNKIVADMADLKQLVNALIDDLQTAGIIS